jgi:2-dehydropantoate 2-reductase
MKVCVFGAGAVGGHIAARLLTAGKRETSIVARGAHLEAIRRDGLRLRLDGREAAVRPLAATQAPAALPAQDLVIVALKAHALPGAAADIAALLAPGGAALFVVNGIPWWWHHGMPGAPGPLPLLDPAGRLWRLLRTRALGGICLWSSEVTAPGTVVTARDGALVVGEPDGSRSARLGDAGAILRQAGIDVRESTDLRADIWEKLAINASLNPVSALTRLATLDIMSRADLRACLAAVIAEVTAIARACGSEIRPDVAALLDPARRPAAHRSSMLQDVLAGRALETDALLGQVVEFARARGVAAPRCESLLAQLRGLAQGAPSSAIDAPSSAIEAPSSADGLRH